MRPGSPATRPVAVAAPPASPATLIDTNRQDFVEVVRAATVLFRDGESGLRYEIDKSLSLGGGLSFYARRHGLASGSLRAAASTTPVCLVAMSILWAGRLSGRSV
mgnify:CR=1 FL=1